MDRGADAHEVEIEVEISDTQGALRVDPIALTDLVRRVLSAEGRRRAAVSIALVDQSTIHAINRAHLGHDWPTDVISFPLAEAGDPTLCGELVVSAEMAAATAAELGVDPGDELALYIVHGLLHLCGHDDTTEAERAAMRRREDQVLMALGIPNPFARRGQPGPAWGPMDEASAPEGPSPPWPEQTESSTWSA